MPVTPVEKIWMNGKLVNWADAKIHVLSHVVHYGSSWFEGIRCYETKKGPAIFRLDKHLERLYDSVRIYHAEIPYTKQQLEDAIIETIPAPKYDAAMPLQMLILNLGYSDYVGRLAIGRVINGNLKPRQDVTVEVTRKDGSKFTFTALCRIDTANEVEYFMNGGILHYVLRKLAA